MEYRKKRSSFETAMVIIIVVLLVLIAIASALLFLRPMMRNQGSKLAVERRLTLGKRYLSEMDYEKAVTEFSEIVRIDKKNTEAYVGLGDAYSGLGKWTSAVENYDTALVTVRDKAGIASAEQPHNQHQDSGTSSALQESGLTREDVLIMANLPDNEYMTDDDLYLIAVAVDPEAYADQDQSESIKTDEIELTVDEIFDIIVRRNDAIEYDLEDIRAKGEDESKYQDYIDWTNGDEFESGVVTKNSDQVDWYAYIRENYIEEIGYASLEPASKQINLNNAYSEYWDVRKGLVSVQIVDLDDDGKDECAVFYFDDENMYETDPDIINNTPKSTFYILLLTTNENGEVVEKENRLIFVDEAYGFCDVVAGIMEFGGRKYIYTEYNGIAYFANGIAQLYTFFAYDGETFRPEFAVGKTGGGSSNIEYSIISYDENGNFTGENVATRFHTWQHADGNYTKTLLSVTEDCYMYIDLSEYDTSIMIDRFDPKGAMVLGLEHVTGKSPDIITIENSSIVDGDPDAQFPTYRNSNLFTRIFHYNSSGPGNYERRNMTITVEDYTNARQMIGSGE